MSRCKGQNTPINEEALIGAILKDPDSVIDSVSAYLLPEDFHSTETRAIFSAAVSLYSSGKSVNITSIYTELARTHQVSVDKLNAYMDKCFAVAGYKDYMIQVKGASVRRAIDLKLRMLHNDSQQPGASISGMIKKIAEAANQIAEISRMFSSHKTQTLQETVPAFLEKIKEKYPDGIARSRMIKTGFKSFDNLYGGLRRGALIYMGARPSMGKTTLSLQWAFGIAKHQGPVLYCSLEVARDELLSKLLALQSFIPTTTIEQGPIGPEQLEKIISSCHEMAQVPLHYTCEITSISLIRKEAQKMKDTNGLSAIFIDRIELLESPDAESRNVQLSRISAELNRLAIDLDIPVVVLCQLSRATARRGKAQHHKPILSDLRDSGSLEQDAKMVIAIHRESMYTSTDSILDDTEIIVLKNMFGACGSLDVWFQKRIPMFTEKESIKEDDDDDDDECYI
jgi:replicative DNA helicase